MMTNMKISKIITGTLLYPITIGEPALIHQHNGLTRTTTVTTVSKITTTEIRFETHNTKYVLRLIPMGKVGVFV